MTLGLHDTPARRSAGLTLIELMIVILIMGIAAGYAVVNYAGMTETQRLNSTVREFVGIYREMRAFCAKERRDCFLEYNIKDGEYRVVVYPIRDEIGGYLDAEGRRLDPFEVEEYLAREPWKRLERSVLIRDIQAPGPNGNETFDVDYWIKFREDGTLPPHVVHFVTEGGLEATLEIEEITGQVTVREGYVEFYSPEEEDFENLSGGTADDR